MQRFSALEIEMKSQINSEHETLCNNIDNESPEATLGMKGKKKLTNNFISRF